MVHFSEEKVGAGRARRGRLRSVLIAPETWRQARQRLPMSMMATRDTGGGRAGGGGVWIKGDGGRQAARREGREERGKCGGETGALAVEASASLTAPAAALSSAPPAVTHSEGLLEPESVARRSGEAAPRQQQQRQPAAPRPAPALPPSPGPTVRRASSRHELRAPRLRRLAPGSA